MCLICLGRTCVRLKGLKLTLKRQEVVNQEPSIQDFKDWWPALFHQKEINAEFLRLMAVPLEDKLFAQLDIHSSQLIRVIRAKGGSTRQKNADIMDILDQTEDIHLRRECVLKALIIFLGEDADDLIKEYRRTFKGIWSISLWQCLSFERTGKDRRSHLKT
ncbi:unnamed protein product [Boreogadus saida]